MTTLKRKYEIEQSLYNSPVNIYTLFYFNGNTYDQSPNSPVHADITR